jgi:tetratricopeptide (TPR) repeat protein
MKLSFASPALALALACLCAPAAGLAQAEQRDALAAADEELESLRIAEARARIASFDPARKDEPRAAYLRGKLALFEGRFGEATAALGQAVGLPGADPAWRTLLERARESERAIGRMASIPAAKGALVFRCTKGLDELLVAPATVALVAQIGALAAELGDRPWAPLEVDLVPDVESLAAASGLSVEQIERTGTVGVTKYGRIMVLTPRALSTGYPWLDTLAHELVHVIVTRVSRNRAPIWLHEGVAKLLERRWRGERATDLTPEEAYLLDRAVREGRLIPLRGFHPSIAFLPNQEDAALAYAQVLAFLRYLDARLPAGWVRSVLEALGRGTTVDDALVALSKFNVRRHYMWWEQDARGRRQTPVPAVGLMKKRFLRGKATGETAGDSLLGIEARRHLRVGDLLRLRGHLPAAVAEFRKAETLSDSPSPEVSDRLAGSLLDLGDASAAAAMLPRMAELYPAHSTIFVELGLAEDALGRPAEAARALERAVAVNPFHPAVRCALARVYGKLGRPGDAASEERACRVLSAGGSEK